MALGLMPGKEAIVRQTVMGHMRFDRLIINTQIDRPDIGVYNKTLKVKGSRRKGQRASQRWAIDCILHHRIAPQVVITDIRINNLSYFMPDVAVPTQLFGKGQIDTRLAMGSAQTGDQISLTFRNLDMRVANLAATFIVQRTT